MKKIKHASERRVDSVREERDTRKPSFLQRFRNSALVTALIAGLNFAAPTAVMTIPNTASAQQLTVQGTTVETERLSDTIANLDTQSNQYRRGERTDNGTYNNVIIIPGELSSSVSLSQDGSQRYFGVFFPKEKDRDPKREGAGTWVTDISDFAALVKKVTNRELTRVKMLVARTTDPNRNDPIISIYVLPVDANGNITGRHRGGYLAMGASYYPKRGVVYGARVLLLEPGTPEPPAVASR